MSTFIGRLTALIMIPIIGFLILWFPGGLIIMGTQCHGSKIDGWDWIFSVLVPFYGVIEAMVC